GSRRHQSIWGLPPCRGLLAIGVYFCYAKQAPCPRQPCLSAPDPAWTPPLVPVRPLAYGRLALPDTVGYTFFAGCSRSALAVVILFLYWWRKEYYDAWGTQAGPTRAAWAKSDPARGDGACVASYHYRSRKRPPAYRLRRRTARPRPSAQPHTGAACTE